MTDSVTQDAWQLNANAPELLISNLDHFGLISVTGEQAKSFIHGQVTTDIMSLADNQWRWGAHCDPKGKMLASFRTFMLAEQLMLLMPATTVMADLPQLQKYAVFSQAELVNASSQYRILGIAGTQASAWLNQQFGAINDELTVIKQGVILKDGERYIVIMDTAAAEQLLNNTQVAVVEHQAWQALEILAGYPNILAEHQGQYVPQMCNLQALNGISFNKGCYMGQETIARMKYRGGNKRALYIIQGQTQQTINADSQLEIALDGDFRRGGKIIEFVQQGEQVLMTAVLANDTENDAILRIAGDEQAQLTIVPLPYSLAEE